MTLCTVFLFSLQASSYLDYASPTYQLSITPYWVIHWLVVFLNVLSFLQPELVSSLTNSISNPIINTGRTRRVVKDSGKNPVTFFFFFFNPSLEIVYIVHMHIKLPTPPPLRQLAYCCSFTYLIISYNAAVKPLLFQSFLQRIISIKSNWPKNCLLFKFRTKKTSFRLSQMKLQSLIFTLCQILVMSNFRHCFGHLETLTVICLIKTNSTYSAKICLRPPLKY